MKIENISGCIRSKPTKVQIAKDDKWEDVWVIDLTQQAPSGDEIEKYLQSSSFQYVSIEVLFEQPDGVYIFGMDHNDHILVKTPHDFLMTVIGIATTYTNFGSFLQELDRKLIGKSYLLHDEPYAIRIGVVNHWLSVSLCIVWQQGWAKAIMRDELRQKLVSNPQLHKTKLNYQGMSFVVNLKGASPGLCHWMKSPCSTKEGEYWILSEEQVVNYIKDWADITVT